MGPMVMVVKYHLDWLYYVGEYREACRIGEEYIRVTNTGIRREIYESILICATKDENQSLAVGMLEYLESLDVQDSGLDYVCCNSRKALGLSTRTANQDC